jgi:hypothetical protein
VRRRLVVLAALALGGACTHDFDPFEPVAAPGWLDAGDAEAGADRQAPDADAAYDAGQADTGPADGADGDTGLGADDADASDAGDDGSADANDAKPD